MTRGYIRNIPLTGVVELSSLYEDEVANRQKILCIMKMVAIKDSVKKAIQHYHNDQPLDVQQELTRLNGLYDSFVARVRIPEREEELAPHPQGS